MEQDAGENGATRRRLIATSLGSLAAGAILPLLDPGAPAQATPSDREAPLDIRADFGAVGDGHVDDTDAIQRALDSSTASRPRCIVIPAGTFRITRALRVPFAPGTQIQGTGPAASSIVQASNGVPILRFAHSLTHTISISAISLSYQRPQTNPSSIAVLYADDADPSASWFRHRYESMHVRNAYDGFAIGGRAGNQTMWESIWRDVHLFRTRHRAFAFRAERAAGQPSLTFENVGVFNTGADSVVSTGPAFDLQAAEALLLNVDIEGWTGQVLHAGAGGWIDVRGMHVESHCFAARRSNLVYLANGTLSIDGFSISGRAEGSVTDSLVLFAIDAAGRLTLRNGSHSVGVHAHPYLCEVFWNGRGRGDVSVIVENLRRAGGSIHQPGTGGRARETAAMMTASGMLPDGQRGFSAPYGGAVFLFSPNGSRFKVFVDNSGRLHSKPA